MGHFSYTCHLSGVPITGGTECVLLFMLPRYNVYGNEFNALKRYGQGSLISNDGPNMYFNEMCFPLFGSYNEYGGLENIVKDDNVEVLEKFFNLKIADIVACVLDGRKDQYKVDVTGKDAEKDEFGLSICKAKLKLKKYPNQIFLIRASATWYRRDVYNNLIQKSRTGKKDYFDKLDLGVFGLLEYLGFKKSKDLVKGRYNIPFTKDGLTIYSDGNWISDKPGENGNMSVYDLISLKKWCLKKGVEIDISELNNLSHNAQIYKCILPKLKKLESHDRWNTERVLRMLLGNERLADYKPDQQEEYKKSLAKEIAERDKDPIAYAKKIKKMQIDVIGLYQRLIKDDDAPVCTLPLLYLEMIKEKGNDFLLRNIDDWFTFKSYYYSTGRFLYPIGTSSQDGDYDKVLELMEASIECLKVEIANRQEEDEEELDEILEE